MFNTVPAGNRNLEKLQYFSLKVMKYIFCTACHTLYFGREKGDRRGKKNLKPDFLKKARRGREKEISEKSVKKTAEEERMKE